MRIGRSDGLHTSVASKLNEGVRLRAARTHQGADAALWRHAIRSRPNIVRHSSCDQINGSGRVSQQEERSDLHLVLCKAQGHTMLFMEGLGRLVK